MTCLDSQFRQLRRADRRVLRRAASAGVPLGLHAAPHGGHAVRRTAGVDVDCVVLRLCSCCVVHVAVFGYLDVSQGSYIYIYIHVCLVWFCFFVLWPVELPCCATWLTSTAKVKAEICRKTRNSGVVTSTLFFFVERAHSLILRNPASTNFTVSCLSDREYCLRLTFTSESKRSLYFGPEGKKHC